MSRRIRVYKQYNDEAIEQLINFQRAATKTGSSLSSVTWTSSNTSLVSISGQVKSGNNATALLTANANNTGVVRIEVLGTLGSEKIKVPFDINVCS